MMTADDQTEFVAQSDETVAVTGSLVARRGPESKRSSTPTRVSLNTGRVLADIDRRLFGGFLEHLGRAVYEGVFDPGSALADENGFRIDLAACVQAMEIPVIRYPGGNFVSGYDWLDGVGPPDERPAVLDKAWNTLETNRFGTNEFMQWCQRVGSEPMLVFNLGTNTPEMAAAYVDYCNGPGGTRWSELRKTHGVESPHGVRTWCLGNELDGPWQQGHMSADEYGRLAVATSRQVRAVDPGVELIACGSSNTELPTYLHWDRTVLEHCYQEVDAICLHNYFGNTAELSGNNSSRYLAMNMDMERQIQNVATVCDEVQEKLRTSKKLWLAFDEWNIWYRARSQEHMDGKGQVAPPLLEERYNLEDALLVGGIINTLLRQSARVRIACLAQIVNVIAPLMTNEQGLLKQTIFYPYDWALKHARGRVLNAEVLSEFYTIDGTGLRPDFARADQVPFMDVVATFDAALGEACVFILNRDLDTPRQLSLCWDGPAPTQVLAFETLTHTDLKAGNTFEQPLRVAPASMEFPKPSDDMNVELPAASYSMLRLRFD